MSHDQAALEQDDATSGSDQAALRPTLDDILCAVVSLQSASLELAEYARDLATDPEAKLSAFGEAPQTLADALATTLDSLPALDDDANQLLGALARYLEGWTR
jgi:hypothetical protein